jgi:sugar phosphate isomerase/epimerase
MTDPLPIAVQLYTLRDLPGGLPERLRVASAAGYRAVETVGTHGLSAQEMREQLDEYGLRAVSSHIALTALRDDLEAAVAFARGIGNDTLVVPWLPEDRRPRDRAGWRALGEELGALGARCADVGIRLLYHNHDFEMPDVDGAPGIVWLLDAAQEEHLGFEPDLAWIVRGGGEPAALLDRYAGRCPRIHVKDLAHPGTADDEGGWAAVGSGTLDWDRWLRAAKAAGAEWYVVEHDAPRDAAETIRESFTFLAASPVLRRD